MPASLKTSDVLSGGAPVVNHTQSARSRSLRSTHRPASTFGVYGYVEGSHAYQVSADEVADLGHVQDLPLPEIHYLPDTRLRPLWFQWLVGLQHGVSSVTILLSVAMLVVYAQTIHTQERWGQAYQKLQQLQRHERQLITASELLREQEAHPNRVTQKDFLPMNLARAIFVKPAPRYQAPPPPANLSQPVPASRKPLAY